MASGDTLCVFTSVANEPPTTNYALFAALNAHPVLAFTINTNQEGKFTGVLSPHYTGGGITAYIHYSCAANTNNVTWGVSFDALPATAPTNTDNYAAEQTTTNAVPGTANTLAVVSIAFTNGAQIDSLAAGNAFHLKIRRTDNSANGDAHLIAIELKET